MIRKTPEHIGSEMPYLLSRYYFYEMELVNVFIEKDCVKVMKDSGSELGVR